MASVRDVMTDSAECITVDQSTAEAARKMSDLDVGALPICDGDQLKGMLTDRDIVVKVLAKGKDPNSTTAGELANGEPVTVAPDDSVSDALRKMKQHAVRRLPVVDGDQVVGIVSQGDLATQVDEEEVGELVEAISAAP